MITIAKEIEKEKVLTVGDMGCGDSFIILISGWYDVYLMCNDNKFVEISTGEVYEVYDYENLPVRKVDFTLVEKQKF